MNIFFDLDDTLYDKSASLRQCGNLLFSNFLTKTEIEQERFVEVFLQENSLIQPKIDVFRKLSEEFKLAESTEREMLNAFDHTFHTYSQRFEYVLETFEFLKSLEIKIGCVTNGRDFFQRNKISASAFVGDSLQADMIPAKELGMVTIWKSDSKVEVPAYVDYRLDSFANFQRIWQAATTR